MHASHTNDLMDWIFLEHVGKNRKVYINGIMVKTKEGLSDSRNLGINFGFGQNIQHLFKPLQMLQAVQDENIFGIMLVNKIIKANSNKCYYHCQVFKVILPRSHNGSKD